MPKTKLIMTPESEARFAVNNAKLNDEDRELAQYLFILYHHDPSIGPSPLTINMAASLRNSANRAELIRLLQRPVK